ncbi:unnamed protein product [Amoebophrya sp. A120]|nr:unnamed protein product [Amoebophrya sp. A120]|eukprot:GSA120T00001919001.1
MDSPVTPRSLSASSLSRTDMVTTIAPDSDTGAPPLPLSEITASDGLVAAVGTAASTSPTTGVEPPDEPENSLLEAVSEVVVNQVGTTTTDDVGTTRTGTQQMNTPESSSSAASAQRTTQSPRGNNPNKNILDAKRAAAAAPDEFTLKMREKFGLEVRFAKSSNTYTTSLASLRKCTTARSALEEYLEQEKKLGKNSAEGRGIISNSEQQGQGLTVDDGSSASSSDLRVSTVLGRVVVGDTVNLDASPEERRAFLAQLRSEYTSSGQVGGASSSLMGAATTGGKMLKAAGGNAILGRATNDNREDELSSGSSSGDDEDENVEPLSSSDDEYVAMRIAESSATGTTTVLASGVVTTSGTGAVVCSRALKQNIKPSMNRLPQVAEDEELLTATSGQQRNKQTRHREEMETQNSYDEDQFLVVSKWRKIQIHQVPFLVRLDTCFENAGLALCAAFFESKRPTDAEADEELASRLSQADATRNFAILILRSGRFSGAIFSAADGRCLLHKTFRRYTVRAKAGGSQSAKDNTGKSIKSAGSTLRRYGEQQLENSMRTLFRDWEGDLRQCKGDLFLSGGHDQIATLVKCFPTGLCGGAADEQNKVSSPRGAKPKPLSPRSAAAGGTKQAKGYRKLPLQVKKSTLAEVEALALQLRTVHLFPSTGFLRKSASAAAGVGGSAGCTTSSGSTTSTRNRTGSADERLYGHLRAGVGDQSATTNHDTGGTRGKNATKDFNEDPPEDERGYVSEEDPLWTPLHAAAKAGLVADVERLLTEMCLRSNIEEAREASLLGEISSTPKSTLPGTATTTRGPLLPGANLSTLATLGINKLHTETGAPASSSASSSATGTLGGLSQGGTGNNNCTTSGGAHGLIVEPHQNVTTMSSVSEQKTPRSVSWEVESNWSAHAAAGGSDTTDFDPQHYQTAGAIMNPQQPNIMPNTTTTSQSVGSLLQNPNAATPSRLPFGLTAAASSLVRQLVYPSEQTSKKTNETAEHVDQEMQQSNNGVLPRGPAAVENDIRVEEITSRSPSADDNLHVGDNDIKCDGNKVKSESFSPAAVPIVGSSHPDELDPAQQTDGLRLVQIKKTIQNLRNRSAGPASRDSKGRVPFYLAKNQTVRDAFRRIRGLYPEALDWDEGLVPPAITEESENAKKQKLKEKKKRQKENAKANKQDQKEKQEHERKEAEERQRREEEALKGPPCAYCGKGCGPNSNKWFRRLEYIYDTADCVKAHQRQLAADAAARRFQS